MEVEQLEYQRTLTSTPRAQLNVMPNPEVTPARADRDWRLVEALRLREPTAADRLVATYGDRAYRLAVRITGNEQDAEEAVQDAFWSVVRKIDTFRGDSAFGSWVYRIVSNAAYGKVRRRPQAFLEIPVDEVLPPFDEDGRHAGVLTDWSSSIDDPAVQTELRSVLSSAVSELPAHYRAVIVLHDVEGLSMAEVADALGITVPTAKTRAHRARLLLRKRLSMFMASAGASVEGSLERNTREQRALQRDGRHPHPKGSGCLSPTMGDETLNEAAVRADGGVVRSIF
jgi:RNA polymerase sigma-70 factor (ECF subfamily)